MYFLGAVKPSGGKWDLQLLYWPCVPNILQAKVADGTSRKEELGDKVDKWKYFGFLTSRGEGETESNMQTDYDK